MSPEVMLIVGIAIGLALVYAGYYFAMRQWQNAKWRSVAEEAGLGFEPGGLFGSTTISGFLHGVPVSASSSLEYRRRTGTYVDTQIEAQLNEEMMPAGLGVGRENLLDTLIGSQDIEIGEASFDKQFRIAADNADYARALLNKPEVRQAITVAAKKVDGLHVYQDKVEVSRRSRFLFGSGLHDCLEQTAQAAAALASAAEGLRPDYPRVTDPAKGEFGRIENLYKQVQQQEELGELPPERSPAGDPESAEEQTTDEEQPAPSSDSVW